MPSNDIDIKIVAIEHAHLHRESYITVLKSFLKTSVDVRKFANRLGISTRHLRSLLDPLSNLRADRDLADKIAELTPLALGERQDLLTHLRLSSPQSVELAYAGTLAIDKLTYEQARDVMLWINNAEFRGLYASSNDEIRRAYHMIIKMGDWAIARMNPYETPYQYAKITTSLNLAANILNKHVNAVWYTRANINVARQLEYWPESDRPFQLECLINALNSASVTYQILSMPAQALKHVAESKQLVIDKVSNEDRKRLIPKVVLEELNILAISPAISLNAVEQSREWGLNALYSGTLSHNENNVMAVMINRNAVASYVQFGSRNSLSSAERIISDTYSEQFLSTHGPLIHALHLRTAADLSRKQRDLVSFRSWMHQALRLAEDAGLDHQVAEILSELQST